MISDQASPSLTAYVTPKTLIYSDLRTKLNQQISGYSITDWGAYLTFESESNTARPPSPSRLFHSAQLGWKLHISVDQTQIDEAWAIIFPLLQAHEIIHFKLLCPADLNKILPDKISKQITIYQFKHTTFHSIQWQMLLQDIESALRKSGILSVVDICADRKIPHSRYFSYRNDRSPQGKYIADTFAENTYGVNAYNPCVEQDPFVTLCLTKYEDSQESCASTLLINPNSLGFTP